MSAAAVFAATWDTGHEELGYRLSSIVLAAVWAFMVLIDAKSKEPVSWLYRIGGAALVSLLVYYALPL